MRLYDATSDDTGRGLSAGMLTLADLETRLALWTGAAMSRTSPSSSGTKARDWTRSAPVQPQLGGVAQAEENRDYALDVWRRTIRELENVGTGAEGGEVGIDAWSWEILRASLVSCLRGAASGALFFFARRFRTESMPCQVLFDALVSSCRVSDRALEPASYPYNPVPIEMTADALSLSLSCSPRTRRTRAHTETRHRHHHRSSANAASRIRVAEDARRSTRATSCHRIGRRTTNLRG